MTVETPSEVEHVEFDNVRFSYDPDEEVLKGINFDIKKGEFIAFVGQSGAGKSTIVSVLARLYNLDSGVIKTNGRPVDEMDLQNWRDRIAVVRQNPFIFNNTLRYNLTIGNRDVTDADVDRACEMVKVGEFLDELLYDCSTGRR